MKDICEAAQLSRGGLYCHYESTRQIFQEIMDDMTSVQENVLDKYASEMMDSQSSLSVAIYEYFSMHEIACQKNALYEQYAMSANTWKKLMQYGIDRKEFHEVEIAAVFDLIVFSYQGVRMYSRLMPIDKEIPLGILKQIRKILVRSDCDANHLSSFLRE